MNDRQPVKSSRIHFVFQGSKARSALNRQRSYLQPWSPLVQHFFPFPEPQPVPAAGPAVPEPPIPAAPGVPGRSCR